MEMYHRKLGELESNSYDINSKIMLTAVLSLSFVILLVIILHIYARCVLRHPNRRPLPAFNMSDPARILPMDPPATPQPKKGLDPTAISSLPSFVIAPPSDGQECSVCLSVLEEDDVARRLPSCGHVFHVECIDMWLAGQPTCPVCRAEVTPRPAPLEREPPRSSGDRGRVAVELVVVTGNSDVECNIGGGKVSNGSSSSSSTSSSSFRLSSFRRMLGRERSSSSRRIQVLGESDLERQTSLQ